MADLPGYSVAITSTCTSLERFDEIGTGGKCTFENEFLEMAFRFIREILVVLYIEFLSYAVRNLMPVSNYGIH